ncbi:hypothetical protein AALA17_07680 [Lactobacillaceae bacterium 24-114]
MVLGFRVKVKLSGGKIRDYLLANDVEPGLRHRYETRDNWQDVLEGALINVPVAAYLGNGRHMPPIATGKVISVMPCLDELPRIQRTRSQFIMPEIWKQQTAEQNYNFMRHDYSYWTQKQIKADIDYWKNGQRHYGIEFITHLRSLLQNLHLNKEV